MAFCGALAFLHQQPARHRPADRLSRDQPGGLDSVAIIAAASESVDLSFVMAMQGARLLIVLLIGPWLARLVARRLAE